MRRWLSAFGLGMQVAVASRSTRLRTGLTAAGVALGVALLLVAASVPHALSARSAREDARTPNVASAAGRLWLEETDTAFRGSPVSGVTLEAVGRGAPVPPGLRRLPGDGQMDVSPALASLLRGPGGGELGRRLDARVVGTISDAGLNGPDDPRFYRGSSKLAGRTGASAVSSFGSTTPARANSPIVTLLVIVAVVALLLPVGVFMATAARFGSEDRDRRLAAMRLVGADTLTTARVAAGESLVGGLVGVVLGAIVFVAARPLAGHVTIAGVSVFASDIEPSAVMAAVVVVLVPLSAVLATLLGLRRIAIEPLGLSRRGARSRRRVAWRVVAPVVGFALLLALTASGGGLAGTGAQAQAAFGVLLVLVGLTALLPWLVERLVRRAPDGPLPWLLAIRRLRADDGTTGRVVGAIGLAVAGAIALQMLFSAAQADRAPDATPAEPAGAMTVTLADHPTDGGAADASRLRSTPGVASVVAVASAGGRDGVGVATVAPCATLARLASLGSCAPGDSFLLREPGSGLRPGGFLGLAGAGRVPADARFVAPASEPPLPIEQLLLTPASAQRLGVVADSVSAVVDVAPGDPRAVDRLRDRAAEIDPLADVRPLSGSSDDRTLARLRRAVVAGAVVVLVMIGASLLVAAGEQLRDRRRVLAVLAAVGTPRSTMAWSVLWQAAIPVAAGLALAVGLGAALGSVLAAIVHLSPSYDWGAIALLTAAGGGVIAAVTLITLPLLWRLMRPEALRVE